MSDIKDIVWEKVDQEVKRVVENNSDYFRENPNSKFVFMQKFDEFEKEIKSKFMQMDVVELDSHKVAAIIICSIIEANVIKVIVSYDEERMLFDGNEKIAVDIGLSYMRSALKSILKGTSEDEKFNDYVLPEAMMCDTEYATILSRNLYYAKTYYTLNPIDIANTLFLLENITLLKCGIDLKVVKENSMKLVNKKAKKEESN